MLSDRTFSTFSFVLDCHGKIVQYRLGFTVTDVVFFYLRFIQTAIISPGSHVNVISKGLAYSTLSLLSTVLFLLFAIHMNSWKLDKKLGELIKKEIDNFASASARKNL